MWDTDQEAWWSPHHIANSRMDHLMHRRSSEGPLWLTYWGYTYIWCTVRILHITNSQMVYSMHRRSSEGLLWLTYWGYTYMWCTVRVLHITAFHWCEILTKTLGGSLIISQTAGWTIQCTGDHRRGRFDRHTEVTHIYDVLLESCTLQLPIDVKYWPRSLVVPSSYHKQLDGPFNAPEIIGGAALTDILRLHIYMMYC